MLSILIPVYNFKVEKLVKALMRQCKKLDIDFEILCFDDVSRKKIRFENSVLAGYFGVNYTELSEKLGRARIRNWMAKSASFKYLLFMDCDSKLVRKDFIKKYLDAAESADIVCGGRIYSTKPPRAKSKRLHWQYGRKNESRKASVRQKKPYLFFHTNNFLVRAEVAIAHPFDEELVGYGYEDLLWAWQLQDGGFDISHIDNPVEHLGLEKSDVFMRKQKESISNLVHFQEMHEGFETRLTLFAERLERFGLGGAFMKYYRHRSRVHEEALKSGSTSLFKLSLLKLYWYFTERGS